MEIPSPLKHIVILSLFIEVSALLYCMCMIVCVDICWMGLEDLHMGP